METALVLSLKLKSGVCVYQGCVNWNSPPTSQLGYVGHILAELLITSLMWVLIIEDVATNRVNQTALRFSLFTLDILTQCHAVLQPMIEIVENIHYSHSWHLFKNRMSSFLNIHGILMRMCFLYEEVWVGSYCKSLLKSTVAYNTRWWWLSHVSVLGSLVHYIFGNWTNIKAGLIGSRVTAATKYINQFRQSIWIIK